MRWKSVHVRTRHIDDVVENSLKTGISQIVNLGAGLDSRAYRIDALRSGRVFELDFPATQEYKKKRVREILGSLPGHVSYVPIDFAKQDLAIVLNSAGFDRKAKSLFILPEGSNLPARSVTRICTAAVPWTASTSSPVIVQRRNQDRSLCAAQLAEHRNLARYRRTIQDLPNIDM